MDGPLNILKIHELKVSYRWPEGIAMSGQLGAGHTLSRKIYIYIYIYHIYHT